MKNHSHAEFRKIAPHLAFWRISRKYSSKSCGALDRRSIRCNISDPLRGLTSSPRRLASAKKSRSLTAPDASWSLARSGGNPGGAAKGRARLLERSAISIKARSRSDVARSRAVGASGKSDDVSGARPAERHAHHYPPPTIPDATNALRNNQAIGPPPRPVRPREKSQHCQDSRRYLQVDPDHLLHQRAPFVARRARSR